MDLESVFRGLHGAAWNITSPFERGYNCHAWGVCETRVRWEPSPDDYWPPGLRTGDLSDYNLNNFLRAYERVGFRECTSSKFEFGFQRIAIYCIFDAGEEWPQHTARQTFWGRGWLSKLGHAEDIRHAATRDIEGPLYGRVVRYMKRGWIPALISPSSTWISATIRNWRYRRHHPQGA